MERKQLLIVAGSILAIAGSAWFAWHTTFAPARINEKLHQGVGQVMADETLRFAGATGEIVVITMDKKDSEVLAAQLTAFEQRLKSAGNARIHKMITIDSEKKDKYGPGFGLSASKLVRELKKHSDAAVIVSFVGLPSVDKEELKSLGERVPPLITFCRHAEKLEPLLQRNVVRAAVVPRFQFPAPGPDNPHTSLEWFNLHFQMITPASLGMLK